MKALNTILYPLRILGNEGFDKQKTSFCAHILNIVRCSLICTTRPHFSHCSITKPQQWDFRSCGQSSPSISVSSWSFEPRVGSLSSQPSRQLGVLDPPSKDRLVVVLCWFWFFCGRQFHWKSSLLTLSFIPTPVPDLISIIATLPHPLLSSAVEAKKNYCLEELTSLSSGCVMFATVLCLYLCYIYNSRWLLYAIWQGEVIVLRISLAHSSRCVMFATELCLDQCYIYNSRVVVAEEKGE